MKKLDFLRLVVKDILARSKSWPLISTYTHDVHSFETGLSSVVSGKPLLLWHRVSGTEVR